MKIYKYFIKRNDHTCRRYCYLSAAQRYFMRYKDHRTRSHFRIEDRLGNIIVSNRLIAKIA